MRMVVLLLKLKELQCTHTCCGTVQSRVFSCRASCTAVDAPLHGLSNCEGSTMMVTIMVLMLNIYYGVIQPRWHPLKQCAYMLDLCVSDHDVS
jgi:hypothetical protein